MSEYHVPLGGHTVDPGEGVSLPIPFEADLIQGVVRYVGGPYDGAVAPPGQYQMELRATPCDPVTAAPDFTKTEIAATVVIEITDEPPYLHATIVSNSDKIKKPFVTVAAPGESRFAPQRYGRISLPRLIAARILSRMSQRCAALVSKLMRTSP